MNDDTEANGDFLPDDDAGATTVTMLEGRKVLFDESVGLEPVEIVEAPNRDQESRRGPKRRSRGR